VHIDGALTAPEAIRSIVDERLRATGVSSVDAYAELAARSADEIARLREQIAVPETWLFRYPGSFEALQHRMSTSTSRPFRVLSVACATGAEPFSIAATALSAGLRPDQVSVIGIDPNPAALASARRAELGRMAVRGELPKSYQRNFCKGFDRFLCLHLGIDPEALVACVREAGDDADLDARLLRLFPADLRVATWNRELVQKGMMNKFMSFFNLKKVLLLLFSFFFIYYFFF
jgi:hypothetical protein